MLNHDEFPFAVTRRNKSGEWRFAEEAEESDDDQPAVQVEGADRVPAWHEASGDVRSYD